MLWAEGLGLGLAVLLAASACGIDDRAGTIVSKAEAGVDEGRTNAMGAAGLAGEEPGGPSVAASPPEAAATDEGPAGAPSLDVPTGDMGTAPLPAAAAADPPSEAAGAGGAGPSPARVDATPGDGCFEQLLADGDFEGGGAGWIDTGDVRPTIVHHADPALVTTGVTPQSGDYLAWLGGIASEQYGQKHITTISQEVSVPAAAVSLVFSGYVWVQQSQLGLVPSDWVVLEFLDPAVPEGTYDGLWQTKLWNEQDASTGWVYFEYAKADLTRFVGRTLPFHVDARPDGNGTLSVWLDSLRLEARCPM